MAISSRSKVLKPSTLSDFKRLKSSYRNGKNPEDLKQLHDNRVSIAEKNNAIYSRPVSIMQWLRNDLRNIFSDSINYNLLPKGCKLIQLGTLDTDGILIDRKKKNWFRATPTFRRSFIYSHCHGQYSSRCTFKRYSYQKNIESWGYVINPTNVYIRLDIGSRVFSTIIKAPKGYHWGYDKDGIRIVSNKNPKDDYHFSAAEVFTYLINGKQLSFKKHIVTMLKTNARVRKNLEKKELKEKRIIKKLMKCNYLVTIQDSIDAGNCIAGTQSFCEKNKLDKPEYKVKELAKLLNSDTIHQTDKDRLKLVLIKVYLHRRSIVNS